ASECSGMLDEHDGKIIDGKESVGTKANKVTLVWLYTTLFAFALYLMSGWGITAGAHRLWAHRSYKAKLPLQILLVFFNTIALQDSIIVWAKDHRVHHKYSDTDADPYNAKRGFFFSHIGWLLSRKHPDVAKKGKKLDFTDLTSDPILVFQRKHYVELMILCCFVLPTTLPMYCWNESFQYAFFVAAMLRWQLFMNVTFLVNSAAHAFGNKSYDVNFTSRENSSVAVLSLGEGWHNYHHVFPWDYKTAELGNYSMNFTTAFIDFFAKIGWAYDLKSVSPHIIKARAERTGDGTHTWGWGDRDQDEVELQNAMITRQLNDQC
ncbi:Acyl-CoA Delta-9 desaturase, partial [Pseudolycoriella hygida]